MLQPSLKDQFEPFHGIFGCDLSNLLPYENTLFRFPLRTTTDSDLSKTIYNESMIDELFESLRQEASIILLFLKKVESISMYKRNDDGSINSIFKVTISEDTIGEVRAQRTNLLKSAVNTQTTAESQYALNIVMTTGDHISQKKWFVVNRIGSKNKRIITLRSKLCLLPWIGLALPVDEEKNTADGRIFCFLPLPPDVECRTGLPVHIHGYFGLTDNRRGLTWSGRECQNNETAEWNELLLKKVASSVYCKMLEALTAKQPFICLSEIKKSQLLYATMPVAERVIGHWKCMLDPILQQLPNLRVFFAIKNSRSSWISLENGVLDRLLLSGISSETRAVILKVLSQQYDVVTNLPDHVLDIIRCNFKNVTEITPALIRCVLKEQGALMVETSRVDKIILLSYVLLDGKLKDISGVPLLPLADKTFSTFCQHKHSSNPKGSVFVPKGMCTIDLLPNMSNRFLDNSLPEDVLKGLTEAAKKPNKPKVKSPTQLVQLTNDIVLQNIRDSLPKKWFGGERDKVSWHPGTQDHPPQSWLEAMWNWINKSFSSLNKFEDLPLLPIGKKLGILSRNSKFIFRLRGTSAALPSHVQSLILDCGCTVFESLPSFIQMREDIETYVAPPTAYGILRVLRQVSLSVVVSAFKKIITPENCAVFQEFFSNLTYPISSSNLRLLQQLPLFETLHGTATNVENNEAVSYWTTLKLPSDFQLSQDLAIIQSSNLFVQKLLELLDIRILSMADMLIKYIFPDVKGNLYGNEQVTILMKWVFDRFEFLHSQNDAFCSELKNLNFVCTSNGLRKQPSELFDPQDPILCDVLDGVDDVFPSEYFSTSQVILKLHSLGLKTRTTITSSDILEFAKIIERCGQSSPLVNKKARAFMKILNEKYLNDRCSFSSLKNDLNEVRWIPCSTSRPSNYPDFVQWYNTSDLLLLSEVRSVTKALLVGSSMPLVALDIDCSVEGELGFNKNPPLVNVIKQLKNAIESWENGEEPVISETTKFEQMIVGIYHHLLTLDFETISSELEEAGLKKWIWHGNGFCAPEKIALKSDFNIDLSPQLFLCSKKLNKKLKKLFLRHGVREKFSDEDILGVLECIRMKHNERRHSLHEVTHDLTICNAILHWVVKSGNVLDHSLQEKVLVPVQSKHDVLLLAACKSCTYCDRNWLRKGGSELEIPGNYQVIHSSVSDNVARLLGVPALSTCLLSAETLGFEQTGPYESITNRIKTVLQEYTEGGIFKELIQNADDAHANEVRFLVDWRHGPKEKLLSPDMAACQGPALWAYNDAKFSDRDFENINKLAGATKVDEVGKIGRFGLGFNAVYHLTDVPSFVSREYFVLFDPNTNHIGNHIPNKSRPGIRINLAKNPHPLSAFEDQFQPYNDVFGCKTNLNADAKFDFKGTLFRFPLRTPVESSKSDICQSIYNRQKVVEIIGTFKECASSLLLFTQHVRDVQLFEVEDGSQPNEMKLLLSISKHTQEMLSSGSSLSFIEECSTWWKSKLNHSSMIMPSRCESFEILTKVMKSELMCSKGDDKRHERWLVVSSGGSGKSVELASGEGQHRGLLPCGGVATRLNCPPHDSVQKSRVQVETVNGEAFCFLPLSIATGFPVHVNGYFAVTSNRRGIWERTTSQQNQVLEVRWNESLLEDTLTNAYIQLLNYMKTLQTLDYPFYMLWPVYSDLHSATWSRLVESVYKRIVSRDLSLFRSNDKWMTINEGYILDTELREVPGVHDTMEKLQKNVFDIPTHIVSTMVKAGQKKAVQSITIGFKTFLVKIFLPHVQKIPCSIRDQIICYTLDCIVSGRTEFSDFLNSKACITCSRDGKFLALPSELINPNGAAASLFTEEDHRFPVGECFTKNSRMIALEKLGMKHDAIPWSDICERTKTVKTLALTSRVKAIERVRRLVKFLKDNYEKFSEPSQDYKTQLRHTQFLPFISKCPNDYELPWKGSKFNKEEFFAPVNLFVLAEKYLVGSSSIIVDESDETGCGKLGHSLKILLGLTNRTPSITEVFRQLDCAIESSQNSPGKRKAIDNICRNVYKFFNNIISKSHNLSNTEAKNVLQELNKREWLFIEGKFVPTEKVAMDWSGNGVPYLYCLPSDYRENYGELAEKAGIKTKFSHKDFINALRELKEQKHVSPLNPNEIKLTLCFASALRSCKIDYSEHGQIPLPDSHNVLCVSEELTINLSFWLKDRGDARYVHEDVPTQLALDLGAKSLQNRRLKKYSRTIGFSFGQHEKLTDRLKNIMKSYPCDSGILKELVQNADDAGASEIHFIHDTRKLPHEKVFTNHPEEIQGPALCVFNNKTFTEEDLEGIQKLGIGSKTDDPEKTGQYGIGFNAVYHLTDCPSFLSNNETLCFLDPHCRYAPEATEDSPGERFDNIDNDFKDDFSDIFLGYLGEHFSLNGGTMFRLPLRTSLSSFESLISRNAFGTYTFKKLFDKFAIESKKMLLFLNNITKISLSEIDKDGKLNLIYNVTADVEQDTEKKRKNFTDVMKESKNLSTCDVPRHGVTYPLAVSDSKNNQEKWLIHQCFGVSDKTQTESQPNGREYGLFPRGGIAALLSNTHKETSEYVAYCFLPLPVQTGLPVHVNGHFALDSSRRNLWNDVNENSPLKKWNDFIKRDVLAPGYATLIYEARKYIPFTDEGVATNCLKFSFASERDASNGLFWYYGLFPSFKDSFWDILTREVYRYLYLKEMEVLPVIISDDKAQTSEASAQLNQTPRAESQPQIIRSWRVVNDAYFYDHKNQTKVDEKKLFKILLRMHLPLLLFTQPIVLDSFQKSEIECKVLTPANVIEFIRTFADPKSQCVIGDLPANVSETTMNSIVDLKMLLEYCKMEEKFPKIMQGLPLLVTADDSLRVFDVNNPVYRSKFSDLFPLNADLFVHQDLVSYIPNIECLPEDRVMMPLTVESVNKHLPLIFPEHMRGKSEHISFKYPEYGALSRKWFQRLWLFLQKYTSPGASLSVLGSWPIIPTVNEKLVTIHNGKTVLDTTPRRNETAQAKHVRDILEKLDCPRLNTEITMNKNLAPPSQGIFSTVSNFFERFGLSSNATNDGERVTDQYVSQPHNVGDVLQVLDFMRMKEELDISILTKEDLRTILSFAQNDLENLECKHAVILKRLPIHLGIDGSYFSLSQYAHSCVIPQGVPTEEIARLQRHTDCIFLDAMSSTLLPELYNWLKVGVEISLVDFYKNHIIPNFHIFSRESQESYLKHIKNDVLLSCNFRNKKIFTDVMTDSLLIPGDDNQLHYARTFYDPRNKVFKAMLNEDSIYFPPKLFHTDDWLDFLCEIGMKTKVEENQFLEFCNQVAACASYDREVSEKKSKNLLSYFFENDHLRGKAFMSSLSSIRFIASEKVEMSYLSLHKQYECTSADCQPPFVKFFDAVPWEYRALSWTSAQLLPEECVLKKELLCYLGSQEIPSVKTIASHLQNLSSTLTEISSRNEVLPQPAFILRIMDSIYKALSERLVCRDEKDISERCSEECKSIGSRMKNVPCILVEDGKAIISADKLSFESQSESVFAPFLYTLPRKYGSYEHLMKRLGVTERFTSLQFATVLFALREKCQNKVVNPDLFEKAKGAVKFLFQSLLVERSAGKESSIHGLKELFLPSERMIMVKSSDLIFQISTRHQRALQSHGDMNVMFPLEKCGLLREKDMEYYKSLPQHLKPKLSKDVFKEVLDPNCKNDVCTICISYSPCEFIKRYLLLIKSSEFHSCLIRLLKHQNNSSQLNENEQRGLSIFENDQLKIICMRNILTRLVDASTESPLSTNAMPIDCYAERQDNTWHLYIQRMTSETLTPALAICIKKISGWIFNATSQASILSMLLCNDPSQLSNTLDKLDIKEDFAQEKYKIGDFVPLVFHYLLQQNPLFIFREGEIVAYCVEDQEERDHDITENNEMQYVLAKIISCINPSESGTSSDFTEEYLIDLGKAQKKVSVLDLYKFVQNQKEANEITDLVEFTGDPKSIPTSLDEGKKKIREALIKAWRLPEKLRRKAIKRLYLQYHPDKNPNNVEFANELFKFLICEMKQMEKEQSDIDINLTTLFTNLNRQARKQRDTYNNYRSSCKGGMSGFSTTSQSYTCPNTFEAKRWLKQAQHDFEVARVLSTSLPSYNAWACFLSQQVVEKTLKAALYAKCGLSNEQLHTHDIYSLAHHVCCLRGFSCEIQDMTFVVGDYYLSTRYPNQQPGGIIPANAFSPGECQQALNAAGRIVEIVENLIDL